MNNGKKYKTKQQESIAACLAENKQTYVTAGLVSEYLKLRGYEVGLTTIYRYLGKLEKQGILYRVKVDGMDSVCYLFTKACEESFQGSYLKCEDCGSILKMDCHQMSGLYQHLQEHHHFQVNENKTILYGKCETCLRGR